jgi:hypothetical protein
VIVIQVLLFFTLIFVAGDRFDKSMRIYEHCQTAV